VIITFAGIYAVTWIRMRKIKWIRVLQLQSVRGRYNPENDLLIVGAVVCSSAVSRVETSYSAALPTVRVVQFLAV
jgi:hypothetical protein